MADITVGWRTQYSTETRPWSMDWTLAEDQGDVIGAVTSTLTDLLTGLPYPGGLLGAPTGSGVTVTQTVTALVPGHNYRLMWSANMGGSKISSEPLLLNCPY
jgi:hypothetical protein